MLLVPLDKDLIKEKFIAFSENRALVLVRVGVALVRGNLLPVPEFRGLSRDTRDIGLSIWVCCLFESRDRGGRVAAFQEPESLCPCGLSRLSRLSAPNTGR